MPYHEITIQTEPYQQEILQGYLYTLPIGGLVVDDPADRLEAKENAPDWVVVEEDVLGDPDGPVYLRLYLESEDAEASIPAIKAYLQAHPEQGNWIGMREVDEESWADGWKKYFKPLPVGERLLIKPSWESVPSTKRIVLEIDPGMAFGTGTHETTRLCLKALERISLEGKRVADIGCGSGILSIAAALFGAGHVQATDIDPVSIRQTIENAAINGVRDRIYPRKANLLEGLEKPVDVLVSNILAEILIDMIPAMQEILAENGMVLFSGIIREKKDSVREALEKYGYQIVRVEEEAGWVLLAAERTV